MKNIFRDDVKSPNARILNPLKYKGDSVMQMKEFSSFDIFSTNLKHCLEDVATY